MSGVEKDTTVAPKNVTVALSDTAKNYYTYNVVDKVTDGKVVGKQVVFTATKGMTADEMMNLIISGKKLEAKINATYDDKSDAKTVTLPNTTTVAAETPVSVALTSNTQSISKGGNAYFAAKVSFDDGFGGTITRDDYNVDWYVNGTKVDFAGGNVATIKNALNATIATIEKVSDGTKMLSAIKFTGNAAGTYRVSVSADNGNLTAAKTVTVVDDVTIDTTKDFYRYTTDVKTPVTDAVNKPVEVGGTADFSALKWAAVDTKNVAHAMGDYGLTVGYEIADVTIDGKSYGKDVANNIASVKDGVVTVA